MHPTCQTFPPQHPAFRPAGVRAGLSVDVPQPAPDTLPLPPSPHPVPQTPDLPPEITEPTLPGQNAPIGDPVTGEGDNIPGAHATPHRVPPGPNPAPDGPENPGVPGDGDGEDLPSHDEPDAEEHRPGRAAHAGVNQASRSLMA